MKTEEIKTDGFAERTVKLQSEIHAMKGWYISTLIPLLIFVFVMLAFFYNITQGEEGSAQVIGMLGVGILVLVGIYGYQETKRINKFSNVVMNIESVYSKKQTLEESLGILKEIHFVMKNMEFIADLLNITKGYSEADTARGRTTNDIYRRKLALQKEIMELLLGVLFDLREDMIESLKQNESALIQVKAEVSTHVNGTNILNQVSEVQVVRLDKQIGQFQELQRVLEARK